MGALKSTAATLAVAAGAALLAPAPAAADTAREAAQTLREEWPAVAAQDVQTARPASGLPVARYVSDTIAQLPGSHRRLLISSQPLRAPGPDGALRPVDLTLRDTGAAHEPVAAPFALTIADDGSFRIGPDEASAVTVRPLLDADGADAARMVDGKPFFANARADADALVVPVADGVETFDQLRSADAPETLRYRLDLADGQQVRFDDGMVVVTAGGAEVLRVTPPVAKDAAGRDVPADMRLDGDVITVAVHHRDGGFAYPVMVDPTWASNYDFRGGGPTGNEGLYTEESPGGPWYQMFAFENASAGGLWIKPLGNRTYPENISGRISFIAPGTTRIASAHWRHVSHLNDRERQVLRLALYGGAAPQVFDHADVDDGFADRDIVLDDPTDTATSAQMWLATPACTPGENDCPRFIPSNTESFASAGALDVTLIDTDYPATRASGPLVDLSEQWTNSTADTAFTMGAHDDGAGVLDYQLDVVDGAGGHPGAPMATACNGEHTTPGQGRNICPADHAVGAAFPLAALPNGQVTFRVTASDLAGNTSDAAGTSASWRTFIDRTNPTIAATGQLTELPGWSRTKGDLSVRLRADDTPSGAKSYELWAYDAKDRELLHDVTDACPAPGAITAPCPGAHASTIALVGDALPEGAVRLRARATDYTGNVSDATEWTVHLDRVAPVARATGDLTRLEGSGWSDDTRNFTVNVSARDIGSGVARIALVAVNSEGRRVIASADTCALGNATGDACPTAPNATLTVDAGDLPDGRTSFEVVATDQAGNVSQSGTDWDTYFDRTEPNSPSTVTVRPRDEHSVEMSWDRPADSGGSGIAGYQYQIRVEGRPATQWETTTVPMAKLGGLPPGVKVEVLVRALDRAANPSPPTRGRGASKNRKLLAHAASKEPTEKQKKEARRIYNAMGLVEVNRNLGDAVQTAGRLGRGLLVEGAKAVVKIAARVVIVVEVVRWVIRDDDLDCEDGGFNSDAKELFVPASELVKTVAGASVTKHPELIDRTRDLIRKLTRFQKHAGDLAEDVPDRCKSAYRYGHAVSGVVLTSVKRAGDTLHDLHDQWVDRLRTEAVAEADDAQRQPKTGEVRCNEARDGDGPGKPNYYVYWAPPPPEDADVLYVGISRALKSRCQKHPEERRAHLTTLNLPRLRHYQARGVEEALIAYFGRDGERPNDGREVRAGKRIRGQLQNVNRSTARHRPEYCPRLLVGQYILKRNGYGKYSKAYYTDNEECPGTG